VVQAVDPYMSSEDIEKGARWNSEIAGELETCNFGIICLTPENIEAPWIHFEAGALSKSIESARVSPILLGLKPADVTGPLVHFQSTLPHREDLLRLITSINSTRCGLSSKANSKQSLTPLREVLQRPLDEEFRTCWRSSSN
jgi:hypothetical protein